MKNPRVSRRKENLKIRAEINAKETIAKINKAKSQYFERINKIDKPLARFIKKQREKNQINKIRNENGETTTDNPEIKGSYDTAAAVAKSLQPCPTLCDPIDGSSPGSPVPGILQARTLEWVAISFQRMKVKSESEVAQSCLTLSDPMDCSLPGFSIHGIFQARVLEWGAIAFSTIRDYYQQLYANKMDYLVEMDKLLEK